MVSKIADLYEFLETSEGDCLLFSGSFDPFHLKHFKAISTAYDQVRGKVFGIIISPRTKTSRKVLLEIDKRIELIDLTIMDMQPSFYDKIYINLDPSLSKKGGFKKLLEKFGHRIIRVAGSDRMFNIQLYHKMIISDDRNQHTISSTAIRNGINNGKNLLGLSPSVKKKIIDSQYYK